MKEFTDDEKIIARNIDKEYKWMARSKTGTLRIFKNKPIKIVGSVAWDSNRPPCVMTAFRQIFKSITWEDKEPTLIKDIYDPQILDDAERKYLTAVLKPLPKVLYIKKRLYTAYTCYIYVMFAKEESMAFPFFERHAMYTGMEGEKEYTLDDLGITYDW